MGSKPHEKRGREQWDNWTKRSGPAWWDHSEDGRHTRQSDRAEKRSLKRATTRAERNRQKRILQSEVSDV